MPVGGQANASVINQMMSGYSLALREVMTNITNLNTQVNGQGNGLAYLQSIGYASTANTSNPGNVSDAQLAQSMIAYLYTLAGLYYGLVQQGGSNGTGATMFNFNQELSQLWAGQ